MKFEYMQEKDIKEGINSPLFFPSSDRPKEFIVYKVNNFWNVKFTFREKNDCKLRLKCRDKSDKIVTKDFVSIKTVEVCLRKIGVNEFKVIIQNL